MILPIIYIIVSVSELLFCKRTWQTILKEHNIIKPKKWLINTRNTDYEN
jgi:hypothetical protein